METECRPCNLPLNVCKRNEGWRGVHLQQLQCFEILIFQLGVAFEKTCGAFFVLRGEYKLKAHVVIFFTRFTCAAGDSLTERPAAMSARVSASAASSSHSRR